MLIPSVDYGCNELRPEVVQTGAKSRLDMTVDC